MQPADVSPHRKANKQKLVWGLICLIGPSALFVISILGYALMNFIAISTAPPAVEGELFGQEPTWKPIVNILLFLTGLITVLTWLPGIIVGIILLSTRKK